MTTANTLKSILQILQVIFLRNFMTLQKNLEYFQAFETNKAAWKDSLAGRFLEDHSKPFCTPIAKICDFP